MSRLPAVEALAGHAARQTRLGQAWRHPLHVAVVPLCSTRRKNSRSPSQTGVTFYSKDARNQARTFRHRA